MPLSIIFVVRLLCVRRKNPKKICIIIAKFFFFRNFSLLLFIKKIALRAQTQISREKKEETHTHIRKIKDGTELNAERARADAGGATGPDGVSAGVADCG